MRESRPELGSIEATWVGWNYLESGGFVKDLGELLDLVRAVDMLGGVVNCSEVKAERFKLIIAPLKVIDWGIVPATVYAIEE